MYNPFDRQLDQSQGTSLQPNDSDDDRMQSIAYAGPPVTSTQLMTNQDSEQAIQQQLSAPQFQVDQFFSIRNSKKINKFLFKIEQCLMINFSDKGKKPIKGEE